MELTGVYSKQFLLKVREMVTGRSKILENIDLRIVVSKIPDHKTESKIFDKKGSKKWERGQKSPVAEKIQKGENAWVPGPKTDLKKIRGILNRLSVDNLLTMLNETESIEYTDESVVNLIFTKAVDEPFFSELYAQYCLGLTGLHDLIKARCVEEFYKLNNKSLCRFIGELYKLNLITDVGLFVNILVVEDNKIEESKIELLCELIITIGTQLVQFKDIIERLYNNRNAYCPRIKFMIMDINDYRIGKRKPNQTKAKNDFNPTNLSTEELTEEDMRD